MDEAKKNINRIEEEEKRKKKETLNSLIDVPGRGEILGKRGRIDADGVMDVDGRREILLQRCQHKAVKANLAKVATVEIGIIAAKSAVVSCPAR